jgi:hypothetical protein
MNILGANDSQYSTFKALNNYNNNKVAVNQTNNTCKREVMSNFNSSKNSRFMTNISNKNLFKQQINEKINSCDYNVNLNNNLNCNNNNINLEENLVATNTEGYSANNNLNSNSNINHNKINIYNNFNNSTSKAQIQNKKISDIPLLSSLNFNKSTQKKTEFYSENTIKPSNLSTHQNIFNNIYNNQTSIQHINAVNPLATANQKFTKSAYFNSLSTISKFSGKNPNTKNIAGEAKLSINLNNLDYLHLKKLGQSSVPISNLTSKKNSQNNSKSISRLDECENNNNNNNYNNNNNLYSNNINTNYNSSNNYKVNNNNNNNKNIFNNNEEIVSEKKNKLVKAIKTNSQLMSKFLPITSSNSPKQLLNIDLLKNMNFKKETREELKSINITTSYKLRDNSKNSNVNQGEKISSNHKFFLDLNRIKENKKKGKGGEAAAVVNASFDYDRESRSSKLNLETSNVSIRSTLRESAYYRRQEEKLSNYIRNCKINFFKF